MILIDPRRGSGELLKYFTPFDVEVALASSDMPFYAYALTADEKQIQLPFGDFCFWGNGPDGNVLIGFERKHFGDFIQSMRSNRLSGHQLPGLQSGIYYEVHIILEGLWRVGDSGAIETLHFAKGSNKPQWEAYYAGSRPVLYSELDHYIATLEYKRGVKVKETKDEKATVAYIVSRYQWWNDKIWSQHTSDEAIYAAYDPISCSGGAKLRFTRRTVPDAEKMLAQISGIDAMAYSIAKAFPNDKGTPSMEEVMKAHIDKLAEVKVERRTKKGVQMVKLGEERARRIYLSLRGEI